MDALYLLPLVRTGEDGEPLAASLAPAALRFAL